MVDTPDPANLARRLQGVRRPGHRPRPARRGARPRDRRGVRRRSSAPTPSSSATTCGPSSPGMAGAFADGAAEAGADVVLIGLASTDQLYFASGHLGHPGAMFTASHNPAQYNGIKMCRAGAPADRHGDRARRDPRRGRRPASRAAAERAGHDHRAATCSSVRRPPARAGPGRAAAGSRSSSTPATAWPGYTAPAVFEPARRRQVELVPMYFELDGTFPNHEANPIEPENLVDLQAAGASPRAPTSAWPSTATPTAASSSTSAAGRSRRRR